LNDLPIWELEQSIVAALRENPRLIIHAPTGSGKSTQVPQMVLEHGLLGKGEIVILQPRRLAARMLASRVAFERKSRLGAEVGYQIRFEKVISAKTQIRFVTEGILLRQLIDDPQLRGVSAIIFDEFHERHLYGDITLARALDLQSTARPDLKLIVMSATLETDLLQTYVAPSTTLSSSGRVFPVAIEYLAKPLGHDQYPIWDLAADELEQLASRSEGDVLIFMPGKYEIGRTIAAVRASRVSDRFVALPLHGELPPREQDAALADYDKRKVIVATNVAETSLTIPGIRVVIDSGLARMSRFDARRGINTLPVEKISRASAEQRAGRAGRTAPGVCLRLWTEREHIERAAHELPEVKRLDLAEVVLTLKASGVNDVRSFRWLEPPEARAIDRAEQLLDDLGATDRNRITDTGRQMLRFPVHPRYARMFIAAAQEKCVRAIALIAALTQGRSLLRRAEGKQMREDRDDLFGGETTSDLFVLLRAFRFAENNGFDPRRCGRIGVNAGAAREAAQLFEQFLSIARAERLDTEAQSLVPGAVERCVLAGFADQIAVRLDEGTLRCALVHGRRGVLARESAVHDARLLVASEIREIETSDKEREVLLTLATKIELSWLREVFPQHVRDETQVAFDPALRRVVAKKVTMFHDLVVDSGSAADPPAGDAAELLAEQVIAGNCQLKNWDHAVEQWIARVNFAAQTFPELEIPPIGASDKALLIQQICQGATSYKEIKERPVWPAVKSWLSAAQQAALDQFAPERMKLPNGRNAKISYDTDAPTIAARIQDLYDVPRSLTIGGGRVPLRIQVLAPNNRPIQVTSDLETFWREGYAQIRPELQRRYPKHEWR
jgi:ATP-dependent helicase HrpB